MSKKGTIIISLDFELNWGVHDVFTLAQYKEQIIGAREAIPRMLELFREYDIHATWATVGFLFFKNKKELIAHLPACHPSYVNTRFSPYEKLNEVGENEELDPYHFGSSLIKMIRTYPHQEIATHTFSHYYCLEEGQTIEEFEADLQAAVKVGPTRSLVFPRNQTNPEYLKICKKYGIQSYRGNEQSWIYKANRFHKEGLLKRMFRLSDCYLNISGHHTYQLKRVDTKPIVNLPSSRFLRPYSTKLKALEPLRLNRIKKSIMNAAEKGEVYHLWWHPHNFGGNLDKNIQFLKEILQLVAKLRSDYEFESLNMAEASVRALQLKEEGLQKIPEIT